MVAFTAAAIRIVATHSDHPCLFVPLALLAGGVHLSLIGIGPFMSIWTADALILIFLCLLASAASVAAGEPRHLPVLMLAGGLLVHTHISQPVFVLPIAVYACVGLWRFGFSSGWKEFWRESRTYHAIALALLLLFMLPIALDAIHYPRDNIAKILTFRRWHSGTMNSLPSSLFYLLQFGSYLRFAPDQGALAAASFKSSLHLVLTHWPAYAVWVFCGIIVLVQSIIGLRSVRQSKCDTASRGAGARFIPAGAGLLLVVFVCSMVWGRMQAGGMLYYLGLINYAIYYFAALLGIAAAVRYLHFRFASRAQLLLWLMAAAVTWACRDKLTAGIPRQDLVALRKAPTDLLANGGLTSSRPNYLYFPANAWGVAVGLALELDRRGIPFVVAPDWAVMFGEEHSWTIPRQQKHGLDVPALQIVAADSPGAIPLVDGLAVARSRVTHEINPSHATIKFSKEGNFLDYMSYGWAHSDGDWTASDGFAAVLHFRPLPALADVDVDLDLSQLIHPRRRSAQRVRLFYNGEGISEFEVAREGRFHATIPAALWNSKETGCLAFQFPDAVSPWSVSPSEDGRMLSLGFRQISFGSHGTE
jgi:hypothetical protein